MKPFQERVIAEERELREKTDRLDIFIKSETFNRLDEREQRRLVRQRAVMTEYSAILRERITAWHSPAAPRK